MATAAVPSQATPAFGIRARLNGVIFHGMLISMGLIAVTIDRVSRNRKRTWRFAKAQARNLCRLCGVQVEVRGLEHLPSGPCVFAPNHQSHFDIAILLAFLPGDHRFAAKKELFRHPVMGPILRTLEMVPIDREDSQQAIRALSRLKGASVIIFPEGTRGRDGRLQPFKKGAFATAIQMGVPVVPLVCKGTSRIMPKGQPYIVAPGKVELVVLPSVPTTGMTHDDRARLRDLVRDRIAAELDA